MLACDHIGKEDSVSALSRNVIGPGNTDELRLASGMTKCRNYLLTNAC